MKPFSNRGLATAMSLLVALSSTALPTFANQELDKAMTAAEKRSNAAQSAQRKIDNLDDEIRDKLDQYKQVSKEVELVTIEPIRIKQLINQMLTLVL